MPHYLAYLAHLLRWILVVPGLLLGVAQADEYSDVAQLVRTGKLGDALTKVEAHLAVKPRDPQMRFLKGVIQRDSGKSADAIVTFTKLTEDFPELPEPYNNLAVLYAGQSQFDKARIALEMAIRTNPSYATAHENLGDVYAKLASQAYNKALQLDGANAGVPPKLALIRELFNPGAKGQKPALPSAVTSPTGKPVGAVAQVQPVEAPATPAIAGAASKPTRATSTTEQGPGSSETGVESMVQGWARAWASRDVAAYLAFYSRDFKPTGGQDRQAWESERRNRITGKSKIAVRVERLAVSVDGNTAVARFKQDYRADGLAVTSRKTLNLIRADSGWLIVKETTGS